MVRRLLAILLSSACQPVSADALAEEMWQGEPPQSARKTLQVYVHRLRRIVGDHERVTHDMAGYTLLVEPHELDSRIFSDLCAQAVAARDRGELEVAESLLERAHQLWQGDAYAGLQDVGIIAAEASRLHEARLAALEERFAISLELGRHSMLISDLMVAVASNPYRERLHGHLMLALYRAGRQAEALEVYRETHDLLANELGLEPATDLQQLHQQILRRDPALAGSGSLVRVAGPPVPRLLPRDIADFTGRLNDVERLDAMAGSGTGHSALITAVEGTAGVGKTNSRI